MNDCLFCKIGRGEIPSYTIYEDDIMKAILDIEPMSNGHILVISKEHYKNFFETPDDLIMAMVKVIKTKIYPLLKEKLNITSAAVCQVGKDVKHYHIHVIPIYDDDSFGFTFDSSQVSDIKDVYEKLKTE